MAAVCVCVCVCAQLEQALRLETGDGERDSLESRSLAQQNVDLRRRLDEEQAAYKRKLTAYQEGQQRQAQLVQKLQAKVRQRTGSGVKKYIHQFWKDAGNLF